MPRFRRQVLALVPEFAGDGAAGQCHDRFEERVERLQAGAAKLVRIEHTDTVGRDRGAVLARATKAALRNDSNEARRELMTLAPADRADAQSWLDKANTNAALAASCSIRG